MAFSASLSKNAMLVIFALLCRENEVIFPSYVEQWSLWPCSKAIRENPCINLEVFEYLAQPLYASTTIFHFFANIIDIEHVCRMLSQADVVQHNGSRSPPTSPFPSPPSFCHCHSSNSSSIMTYILVQNNGHINYYHNVHLYLYFAKVQ